MSAELPAPAACGACAALPADCAPDVPDRGRIMIAVPGLHCAGCISKVERGLAGLPGLRSARVNLTLRRVVAEGDSRLDAATLVAALERLGYEAMPLDAAALAPDATQAESRDLLMRVGVSGFAMMNVMLLSVAVWSGAEAATRDMLHWVSAAIALPAIAFSAQPFFRNAWSALRVRRLNMDVPIALAILLTIALSLYETSKSGHHAYFDAAIALTFFLLAGRWLDHRTRASARSAARELTALEVPVARRIEGGRAVEVPVARLRPGDLVQVRPGSRVPADGMVETGESEIDRALITGESLPAFAGPGTALATGEVNLTGVLTMRVTAAGAESSLSRMAGLVALAEMSRNRYTSLADKAAALYAPFVHILSGLAFLVWFAWSGDLRLSTNIAVAILIITCPCALGLAVPAVTTAASARLFRKGILLKSGTALERLAETDVVVFDKTGTLTMGAPELAGDGAYRDEDLALAMALAGGSSHPLARALEEAARRRGVVPARVEGLREVPGYGIEAMGPQGMVRLGRPDWVGAEAPGQTATCLRRADGSTVTFGFMDSDRPGAGELVSVLLGQGLEVHLLSGDAEAPVRDFASRHGIAQARARMRPEDKLAHVEALAAAGHRVLMVGDGLNDTAALARAHVSISPASALDAARVASDIVLLGRDISVIAGALVTARSARRRIKENFALSTAYNVLAVPFAFFGYVTPLIAALAMSLSSVTVTLNALRLKER